MESVQQQVDNMINENRVMVFSKSYCPYCRSTKQTLDGLKAEYCLLELDQEENGASIQDYLESKTGQRTVPNIFIAAKHVGGNADLQAAHKSGELKSRLQASGAIKA
ncbi:glutaredoxin [Streptomyces sp. NPDC052693]|uniref:glutaredoxin n=1 Tax=Streptomyces sp. NPDC052693 TaxID=3155814 RepID=UPI003415FEBF